MLTQNLCTHCSLCLDHSTPSLIESPQHLPSQHFDSRVDASQCFHSTQVISHLIQIHLMIISCLLVYTLHYYLSSMRIEPVLFLTLSKKFRLFFGAKNAEQCVDLYLAQKIINVELIIEWMKECFS